MARGKNNFGIPLEGDAKRVELAGYYRRKEFAEFWDQAKTGLLERKIINDPAMVYTELNRWFREKIIKANPDLDPSVLDGNGYHTRNDHALNSLLNKILPGYKQFLEYWLELYEPNSESQSTLDNSIEQLKNGGEPPARARARDVSLNNDGKERLRETEEILVGDAILRRAVALSKQTGRPIGECVREIQKGGVP